MPATGTTWPILPTRTPYPLDRRLENSIELKHSKSRSFSSRKDRPLAWVDCLRAVDIVAQASSAAVLGRSGVGRREGVERSPSALYPTRCCARGRAQSDVGVRTAAVLGRSGVGRREGVERSPSAVYLRRCCARGRAQSDVGVRTAAVLGRSGVGRREGVERSPSAVYLRRCCARGRAQSDVGVRTAAVLGRSGVGRREGVERSPSAVYLRRCCARGRAQSDVGVRTAAVLGRSGVGRREGVERSPSAVYPTCCCARGRAQSVTLPVCTTARTHPEIARCSTTIASATPQALPSWDCSRCIGAFSTRARHPACRYPNTRPARIVPCVPKSYSPAWPCSLSTHPPTATSARPAQERADAH